VSSGRRSAYLALEPRWQQHLLQSAPRAGVPTPLASTSRHRRSGNDVNRQARATRQQGGAGHDGGEGKQAGHTEGTGGKPVAVEHHSGRDRYCVREHRRDAGSRECTSALEAELQEDEPESMRCQDREAEEQARATGNRRFRPDVSGRVAEPGGDSEPSASGKQAREPANAAATTPVTAIQAATPSHEAWAAKG